MAIPVAMIANAAKSILGNGPVAGNENSAGSSIQNGGWKPEDVEIKRTEGDLGYDEAVEDESAEPKVDEDPTANPMDIKDVADVDEAGPVDRTLPTASHENENTAKAFGLPADFFTNVGGEATSSESPLSLKNILETGATVANPVNYGNSGADSSFSGGSPIAGASAVGSVDDGQSEGLNVPIEQPTVEAGETKEQPSETSESLLEQAEKAFENNKDIDDKELPFVDTEQAAEDVEDLIKSDLPDEKKEEILESANDNGEVEEGEVEKDTIEALKEYKDKAVDIASKIASIFGPPRSSSASSSISKGSGAPTTDVDIKQGTLSDAVSSLIESTKSSGSAPSAPSSIAQSNIKQNVATPNQTHSAPTSKAMPNIKANDTNNSASSSGVSSKGSVAEQFKDIVANGIKSGASTGASSSFKEAINGGPVGSVKQNDVQLGKVADVQQTSGATNTTNNILNQIHKEVAEDFKKWPEKNGVHYKDKGSIAILTENGKDVDVKLGTRRIQPLEKLNGKILEIVEEVV